LDKGTLVYINYTLRVKGEEKPVETTSEEVAKQSGVHNPEIKYEPMLVAVGDRWVVPGLDDALLQMSEGEKLTLEVPPEKGYGQRDPSKIKLIPLRKFGENASRIHVGDQIDVDGQIGVVSYIGSGRVAVDFNHRLAGRTLVYDVEVVKVLKEIEEKVRALVSYALRMQENEIKTSVDGNSATVTLPTDKYEEGAYYMRRIAASYVFKYVPTIRKLVFQEVYERTEEKPTEGAAQVEEAPAQKEEAQEQKSSAEGGSKDKESADQTPAEEPASAPKGNRTRKRSKSSSQATPNSSTSEQA
jgi:peptidylprolyl isomerase